LAAEVALQQLDGIRSRILAEGDDFDSWLQKDQIPSFDWGDLDFRLDWSDYVKILELVLSRRSPEWVCWAAGPFAAVSPFLQSTLERRHHQSYVLHSTMLGNLQPCQAYHHYSQGILQGFPCVLAEQRAQVEIEP